MMEYKIENFICRGASHTLHCEDDFYVFENEEVIVAAVFDGCSSGIDSHFASTMHKYCLREVLNDIPYILREDDNRNFPFKDVNESGKEIISLLFDKIYRLDYKVNSEMLSTVVLTLVNKITKEYFICFAGDGVCKINDEIHSIHDANSNAVWYLSSVNYSDFNQYYNNYCTKFSGIFENEISISSDGIESFRDKFGADVTVEAEMLFLNMKHDKVKLNEKYQSIPICRLYNMFQNGKIDEFNNIPSKNLDDFTIIKIIEIKQTNNDTLIKNME